VAIYKGSRFSVKCILTNKFWVDHSVGFGIARRDGEAALHRRDAGHAHESAAGARQGHVFPGYQSSGGQGWSEQVKPPWLETERMGFPGFPKNGLIMGLCFWGAEQILISGQMM